MVFSHQGGIAVDAVLPKPNGAPWRTVRVMFRSPGAYTYELLQGFRAVVHQIAKKHRLPPSRTTVVWRTTVSAGFYGYIRVYRGAGTGAEKRLLKRVMLTAKTMTVTE